jgi:hypothetical protein
MRCGERHHQGRLWTPEHGSTVRVTTRRLDTVGRDGIPQIREADILEMHIAVLAEIDEDVYWLHI